MITFKGYYFVVKEIIAIFALSIKKESVHATTGKPLRSNIEIMNKEKMLTEPQVKFLFTPFNDSEIAKPHTLKERPVLPFHFFKSHEKITHCRR